MSAITVLVFAKYPTAGTVNTRMVPPLTFEQAARLHQASLLATCETVAALNDRLRTPDTDQSPERERRVAKPRACAWGSELHRASAPGDIEAVDAKLVVTPDDRTDELSQAVGHTVTASWSQGDGDLGQRLARATDRALSRNPAGVVVLGADSPTMPLALLVDAIAKLNEHDAVLGPCADGGYYLIGLRKRLPVLFECINWGSGDVAGQTRDRADAAGISLAELPEWYDLDRAEDLHRASTDLAGVTGTTQPAMIALRRLIESYIAG